MKLKEYLSGKNHSQFARELGVDYSTLWRWKEGKILPNKEMILKIQKITNDSVRVGDWYDIS